MKFSGFILNKLIYFFRTEHFVVEKLEIYMSFVGITFLKHYGKERQTDSNKLYTWY